MGHRKLSARPRHHAQAEGAVALFKTASRPCCAGSRAQARRPGRPGDLVRRRGQVGQKNKVTRRWARRGTRPVAPQETAHGVDVHLWRDPPATGHGRRPGSAALQHPGDEPAPGRDRAGRLSCTCALSAAAGVVGWTRWAAGHRLKHFDRPDLRRREWPGSIGRQSPRSDAITCARSSLSATTTGLRPPFRPRAIAAFSLARVVDRLGQGAEPHAALLQRRHRR